MAGVFSVRRPFQFISTLCFFCLFQQVVSVLLLDHFSIQFCVTASYCYMTTAAAGTTVVATTITVTIEVCGRGRRRRRRQRQRYYWLTMPTL